MPHAGVTFYECKRLTTREQTLVRRTCDIGTIDDTSRGSAIAYGWELLKAPSWCLSGRGAAFDEIASDFDAQERATPLERFKSIAFQTVFKVKR
jgi:hypothetical protein